MQFPLILCLLIAGCTAYPGFEDMIPNGHHVPNSCSGRGTWNGVGHNKPSGTGPLNVFGQDFRDGGLQWNKVLCLKDSDQDGQTNGEELGDPHCQWTPGSNVHLRTPSGHPGICEPMDDQFCSRINSHLNCH